ncbi:MULTISPECIES: hypothetical protein [unclassified Bradyrhizobium]|uniref:hypothetical protein n=1 Tax=unclassified Bradyrhizobium TaxID=2631580 RepID=UPI001FF84599|nr:MULTISPECIES: hypothetical protein [unclassified Bradyrhizobium]MCK1500728.1 hypothetical protein [Bradyrhizobium sp. 188]MCK1659750.1 hypothetical protein [Bradyrhizobium sp. 151]
MALTHEALSPATSSGTKNSYDDRERIDENSGPNWDAPALACKGIAFILPLATTDQAG